MTKKKSTNKELHRALWTWLAKTGKDKSEWPEWEFNGGAIEWTYNNCFACDECYMKCDNCPIDWGKWCCEEIGTPFRKWESGKTLFTKKKYAAVIAKLPWKDGGWNK